jgi:hypothetical protein
MVPCHIVHAIKADCATTTSLICIGTNAKQLAKQQKILLTRGILFQYCPERNYMILMLSCFVVCQLGCEKIAELSGDR